jgi:hypothetical protein
MSSYFKPQIESCPTQDLITNLDECIEIVNDNGLIFNGSGSYTWAPYGCIFDITEERAYFNEL